MAATSTIPDVLSALVTKARENLPDVDVHDGPPSLNVEEVALIIGWDQQQAIAATDDSSAPAPGYGRPVQRAESYEIPCLATVWSGDTDDASMAAQRAQCFAIVDAVDTFLAADKRLGGLVMSARIVRVEAYQAFRVEANDLRPAGREASALFMVHVQNHLR